MLKKSLKNLWQSVTIAVSNVRRSRKSSRELLLDNDERAAIIVGLIQGTAVISRNGKHTELLKKIQSGTEKLLT